MHTDVEELLRDGIDRLTADATLPACLAERARRRNRHRTAALRVGGVAAGVAVAGAAALIVSLATSAAPVPGPRSGRVVTAAYVVRHATSAIAAADRAHTIQEVHMTGRDSWLTLTLSRGGPLGRPITLAATRAEMWLYRGQSREIGFAHSGSRLFDVSMRTVTSHARHVATVTDTGVNYRAGTWWRNVTHLPLLTLRASLGSGLRRWCGAALVPFAGGPGNWPDALRRGLSCGNYRIAGHERIRGVNAIKIVSAGQHAPRTPVPTATATIWVNPATYLPLQARWTWSQGTLTLGASLTADFRWLPPTPANLAGLRVHFPKGFRRSGIVGLPQPLFAFGPTRTG